MITKSYTKGAQGLPDRIFIRRNSLLTELFKIEHVRTIRNIFISIMTVLALQVLLNEFLENGKWELKEIFCFFRQTYGIIFFIKDWFACSVVYVVFWPNFDSFLHVASDEHQHISRSLLCVSFLVDKSFVLFGKESKVSFEF